MNERLPVGETFIDLAALVARRIPPNQRNPELTWTDHARRALNRQPDEKTP